MPLHILLFGLGGLIWVYLMHTRSLPLEGCVGVLYLLMSVWFYALVAVPLRGIAVGQTRYVSGGTRMDYMTSAEAVLAMWTIGFVAAILWAADDYTPATMFIAGGGLLFIVVYSEWTWLPWYEAAFGLYAWDVLLADGNGAR